MDAVAAGSPPEVDAQTPEVFRCGRCGVASVERTGFIIPKKQSKNPRHTRCVTCEVDRNQRGFLSGLFTTLGTIAVPFLIHAALSRSHAGFSFSAALTALLFLTVAICAHELGHAIAARLCGLEVGAILLGQGRKVGSFEVFGVHIRIHAWPLFGQVLLGTSDPQMPALRSRLWLTFLMGPMTNALLAAVALGAWPSFVSVLGVQLASAWVILNSLMFIGNIVPSTLNESGRRMPSDGLALLQIPRYTKNDLAAYLLVVPTMRAMFDFQDENYEAARAAALQGLERAPGNSDFLVTLSACEIRLEGFDAAIALLRPMLDAPEHAGPWTRATVRNNLGVALLLSGDANAHAAAREEADQLSAIAFGMYPSILSFRSTRALMLTACGRPEQALQILEYRHYESAPRSEKSFQHAARAFALHSLGRKEESRTDIARALKLHPKVVELLPRLGLEPVKSVT